MAMTQHDLEDLLRRAFPEAQISVEDTLGDQDHYAVTIVSKAFEGATLVKRHQMVYGALEGRVGTTLHALSVKALTPQEVPHD